MAVIRPTIETDPDELELIAHTYLRTAIQGWEPADGDLLTWTIAAHARMIAEERDIAADVPFEQILRPLGEKVHQISPDLATPATVSATVTMRDRAGYTIPRGMEVLVKTSGDDGVTMLTAAPVTVASPERATAPGAVTLYAAPGREGAAGNGLTPDNEAVVIRSYEFIESIELVGTSSGGRDAETDDAYLQRLVQALRLTSPIPILPDDFAQLARFESTVGRALALNVHGPVPAIVRVATNARATAPLTLRDVSTGTSFTIAPGAAARDVATAFGTGATATGGPLGTAPVEVTISGRSVYGPWETVAGQISVVTLQQGDNAYPQPRTVTVAVTDANGEKLPSTERAKVAKALADARELNWRCSVIDPTYTKIDVDFRAQAWPRWDAGAVGDAALDAIEAYLSPARWGTPPTGGSDWIDEPIVRYLEVAQVLQEVPGLRYVTSLGIAREGETPGTADVTLDGPAALPRVGRNTRGNVREG